MPEVFEGTCDGVILEAPRGTGGFGYDPLFLSDELGKTFGEADAGGEGRGEPSGQGARRAPRTTGLAGLIADC